MKKPRKHKEFSDTRHYSGKVSQRFWNRINRITEKQHHNVAYGLAVALQEIEIRLLNTLDEVEQRGRKRRCTAMRDRTCRNRMKSTPPPRRSA